MNDWMNEWNNYCGWEDSRCILLKLHPFACYCKEPKSVTAFGLLTFFCADLSNQKPAGNCHRLLMVNVCMKEYELTEGGHTFGLLAVSVSLDISIWRFSWQPLSVHSRAYHNPGGRGTQKSFIQGGSTFEVPHLNSLLFYIPISLSKWDPFHIPSLG